VTTAPFAVDASAAALVVVDLQNDFVREGAPQEVPDARASLPTVRSLLEMTRLRSVPVFFTRYTAGPAVSHLGWFSPECGPPLRSCWPGVAREYGDRDGRLEGHEVVDELMPRPGEVIVDKFGYGSFHNTILEDALRAVGTRQVWLVGTVTQICVEETAREAFRRGFEVVVVADAVTSYDPELHDATLRNLAAKFALVVDSAGIVEALGAIGD
jgi:nicotinamidase-related amidase